jgi:hypothetical protein
MRTTRLLPAILAALAITAAACGSSGAPATKAPGTPAQPAATSASTEAPTEAQRGNGDVDCAKVTAALATLIVPLQLMAQVQDPSMVGTLKAGTSGPKVDPDQVLAALHDLHELDGVSSPLGSPKEAIDAYEDAAGALKTLLAKDSPTQADVDAYNAHIGDLSAFLMHQSAISGAMGEAHC